MAGSRDWADDRGRSDTAFQRSSYWEDDRDRGREHRAGPASLQEPRSFGSRGYVDPYAQAAEMYERTGGRARDEGLSGRYGRYGGAASARRQSRGDPDEQFWEDYYDSGLLDYAADPDASRNDAYRQGRYRRSEFDAGRTARPFGGENPALVRQAEGDFYHPGPHRGRGPKNYVRSDERIREDVSDRLADDPYLDASEIEVAVEGGEVTLSGSVENRWAKRRAEDCADDVSGVRHVQNNLRAKERDAWRPAQLVAAHPERT